MDNLALHIEYLLLRHDCVIVPGFGAFLNMRKEADYDKLNKKWFPMKSEVVFNSDIRNDDGLLANSVARKYKISFREARELIEKEVEVLKTALRLDGEYTLGTVGIIRSGEEDRIVFSPFKSREMILSELCYPEIIRSDNNKPSEEILNDLKVMKPVRNLDFDKNYYIPVNKRFARAAAIFIILFLSALGGILLPEKKPTQDRASVAPVVENLIDTAIRNFIPDKKEKSINTELMSEASGIDSADVAWNHPYHLIVGTFSTESEANNFIESYKDKGFELFILSSPTLIRVAAAGAEDKEDLIKLMNSNEFRNIFSQAWIRHQ